MDKLHLDYVDGIILRADFCLGGVELIYSHPINDEPLPDGTAAVLMEVSNKLREMDVMTQEHFGIKEG